MKNKKQEILDEIEEAKRQLTILEIQANAMSDNKPEYPYKDNSLMLNLTTYANRTVSNPTCYNEEELRNQLFKLNNYVEVEQPKYLEPNKYRVFALLCHNTMFIRKIPNELLTSEPKDEPQMLFTIVGGEEGEETTTTMTGVVMTPIDDYNIEFSGTVTEEGLKAMFGRTGCCPQCNSGDYEKTSHNKLFKCNKCGYCFSIGA